MKRLSLAIALVTSLAFIEGALGQVTQAPTYPAPKEGDWTVNEGLSLSHWRRNARTALHYTTVGAPSGEPVVILHGR